MRFENVSIAAFGHVLPDERITSESLEKRLLEVYERLSLRVGRLELMSGIRERRFWPPDTRPSEVAALAGARALEKAGVDRSRIGCLIHASVSRDFMEPATATVVHRELGLPDECTVFDLSNACLGVANGMVVAAGMIERGDLEAALIVAGEVARPLVERTLTELLTRTDVDKRDLKDAFASLTIGSGAAAVVLTRDTLLSDSARRLVGGAVLSATEHNVLCRGDRVASGDGVLMSTDSEALLEAGNALAARTWRLFLEELDWPPPSVDRVITHQVGSAHRRLLLETLAIDADRDYPTVAELGNIGSVSLPLSFSVAEEAGFLRRNQRIALLGIGSGLNCLMLGVEG